MRRRGKFCGKKVPIDLSTLLLLEVVEEEERAHSALEPVLKVSFVEPISEA
jgi:hypothetical protein